MKDRYQDGSQWFPMVNFVCTIPMIIPNRPIALAKISMINIFTNNAGLAASARAAPDPTIPTAKPQTRLLNPTVSPPAKSEYPAAKFLAMTSFEAPSRSKGANLLTKTKAIIMPNMATASQNIIETRFFVRIRGALTPPPRIDDPVVKIPHPAPITDNDSEAAIPIPPHICGEVCMRNHDISNLCP